MLLLEVKTCWKSRFFSLYSCERKQSDRVCNKRVRSVLCQCLKRCGSPSSCSLNRGCELNQLCVYRGGITDFPLSATVLWRQWVKSTDRVTELITANMNHHCVCPVTTAIFTKQYLLTVYPCQGFFFSTSRKKIFKLEAKINQDFLSPLWLHNAKLLGSILLKLWFNNKSAHFWIWWRLLLPCF